MRRVVSCGDGSKWANEKRKSTVRTPIVWTADLLVFVGAGLPRDGSPRAESRRKAAHTE
jgi:hypothetical protein